MYQCKDKIEHKVRELLGNEIIKHLASAFSSLIILVSWRMCVDFHDPNKVTVLDKYPIPTINELIDEFHGSHQIQMYKVRLFTTPLLNPQRALRIPRYAFQVCQCFGHILVNHDHAILDSFGLFSSFLFQLYPCVKSRLEHTHLSHLCEWSLIFAENTSICSKWEEMLIWFVLCKLSRTCQATTPPPALSDSLHQSQALSLCFHVAFQILYWVGVVATSHSYPTRLKFTQFFCVPAIAIRHQDYPSYIWWAELPTLEAVLAV